MNFLEKFDDLKVPEEYIPELLEYAGEDAEFLEKAISAPGNDVKYSIAETKEKSSKLQGKQIAFLGSSVTYGAGSFGESFVDFLKKQDKIFPFKEAVSGTTLAEIGDDSYVARLEKLPVLEKLNMFVLQLSTNDTRNDEIKLGKISDSDKYDITTVTGALEYILHYVKKTWNCPVLVYSNPKFKSEFYQEMVNQTKELQAKWGFTFLNLWDDKDFEYTEDEKKLYMLDEIHPTRAGYKESWLPEFEQAMLRINEKQENK